MKRLELDLMQCPFHPKYKAIQQPRCDCKRCWEIWDLYQEWALKHRIEVDDWETGYAETKLDRERAKEREKSSDSETERL